MTPDTVALLQRYQDLGFRLLYWERKGVDPTKWKGPSGLEGKGWNDPEKAYPIESFDPTCMNLGVFTGHEIQPGRFLTDIDFDWPEGLIFAARIIPPTKFAFGRKGKKVSHAFITLPERIGLFKYEDIAEDPKTGDWSGKGVTFIELRGGDSTQQTMIAPSLHSPDTPIELALGGDILHVETKTAQDAVIDFAICCLILNNVGGGFHHEARIALTGYLLRLGLEHERIQRIVEEICRAQLVRGVHDMSEKDVSDAALVLRSTLQKFNANKKFAGGPSLAEFVGGKRGKGLIARIAGYLGHDDDFIRNEKGSIIAKNQKNIKVAVERLNHELSFDEFAGALLVDGKKMEDREVNTILTDIEIEFHFQPPENYFERVVKYLAWSNPFHPVKTYLNELNWDQVPRIDEWLIRSGGVVDNEYTRAVSSIVLIAGVRRIRQPGCKYDEMVVLESPRQGTDKSSAVAALCPNPAWFSDDLRLNLHSQQLIEATLGKWIVEASDLAGKRKTEIEQLKAMLSRAVDGPARMAYAHFPVERPRHFILIGTTNSSAYLTDTTGSRRFWPLAITQRFDIKWIRANRDQLWAEAAVREAKGESIRLAEELWPAATEEQEARREIDPWESIIRRALLSVAPSGDGRRRVAATAIWVALNIPSERQDRTASLRITDIMQRLGFKRSRVRPQGEEVQIGFVQEHDILDLPDDGDAVRGREPGEDDVPF